MHLQNVHKVRTVSMVINVFCLWWCEVSACTQQLLVGICWPVCSIIKDVK